MNKMKGGRVRKVIGWKSADSRAACNPEMNTHRNNINVWKRKNCKTLFRFGRHQNSIQMRQHRPSASHHLHHLHHQSHHHHHHPTSCSLFLLHYDKYSVVNKM